MDTFSFHNPEGGRLLGFDMDSVGEAENLMVNAYGRTIRRRYHYCSDSNGYWRHERLYDVVSNSKHERLHILTHPEWWLQRPMTPKSPHKARRHGPCTGADGGVSCLAAER